MDHGDERDLITMQLGHGISVFACDFSAVLSSRRLELVQQGRHLFTESLGDMHCEYGGPYNLALNSEIFVRAWKKVLADATYLQAKLTVKVDPDAVFLPARLRRLLSGAHEEDVVYFNNCDQGLHGPIEVLTRGGMRTLAKGIADCERELAKEFTWAGEDVFIRHCLGYLQVNRVDNFNLLSEDHCFNEAPGKDGCVSGKVSFHPFKQAASYLTCLDQARSP